MYLGFVKKLIDSENFLISLVVKSPCSPNNKSVALALSLKVALKKFVQCRIRHQK